LLKNCRKNITPAANISYSLQKGWQCPKCLTIYNPDIISCDCQWDNTQEQVEHPHASTLKPTPSTKRFTIEWCDEYGEPLQFIYDHDENVDYVVDVTLTEIVDMMNYLANEVNRLKTLSEKMKEPGKSVEVNEDSEFVPFEIEIGLHGIVVIDNYTENSYPVTTETIINLLKSIHGLE